MYFINHHTYNITHSNGNACKMKQQQNSYQLKTKLIRALKKIFLISSGL